MTVAHLQTFARVALVVLVAVVVQVSIAADFGIFGVRPEVLLWIVACVGVSWGPRRGAVVGFALGLLYDVYLQTPLGVTALVYLLVGYGIGALQLSLAAQTRWLRMVAIGAATALGVVLWVVVGGLFDAVDATVPSIARVALVAGAVNVLIGPPGVRVARWMYAPAAPVRAV